MDSLLTGLDSHGDGGTLVLCLDQGEDVLVIHRRLWWEEVDVYEANASGDEYTDYPGVLCHKTTRDQFLLWEYTGISPSMLSYCSMYT